MFEIYKTQGGWRWMLKVDSKVLARGDEVDTKEQCMDQINAVRNNVDAEVVCDE